MAGPTTARTQSPDYAAIAERHERLRQVGDRLRAFQSRHHPLDDDTAQVLADIKADAVAGGDQDLAGAVWCYESILAAQNHYLSFWTAARSDRFYAAWCELERAELALHFLARHFSSAGDEFGLEFLHAYIPKWQELFPYRVFLSPGMVQQEIHCGICDERITPRRRCGHVTGDLYDGVMATRVIKKVRMLEISVVDHPVQKYSVAFMPGMHYNYALVHYVVMGLLSPWHRWEPRQTKRTRPDPKFAGVGRNDLCPCGSGKKFKRCHVNDATYSSTHYDIHFVDGMSDQLPPYSEEPHHGLDDHASSHAKELPADAASDAANGRSSDEAGPAAPDARRAIRA